VRTVCGAPRVMEYLKIQFNLEYVVTLSTSLFEICALL
jgi:hypothetical protein